jgi:hypothetical protein
LEAAGVLGDTLDFLTDASIDTFEGLFGYSPFFRQFMLGPPSDPENPTVGLAFPTSEDLREITRAATGDFLEPRNEFEARVDEIIGDLGALLTPIPGTGAIKGIKGAKAVKAMSPVRALGTAIAANLAAEGLKQLDFDEGSQAIGKVGMMFALGMLGRDGARGHVRKIFNEAEAALPEGATVSAANLVKRNRELLKEMDKGLPLANKEAIKKQIFAINNKVDNGRINGRELTQINRDLNELVYDVAGGPENLERARKALIPLRSAIKDSIGDMGKEFPEFIEKWKEANSAWAGIKASEKVSAFAVRSGLSLDKLDPKTKALVTSVAGIKGTAAKLATTQVAKGAEVLHQVMGDPVLRKFYMKMVGDGIKENANGYIKNLRRLDKEIKKIDELKRKEREKFLKSGRVQLA